MNDQVNNTKTVEQLRADAEAAKVQATAAAEALQAAERAAREAAAAAEREERAAKERVIQAKKNEQKLAVLQGVFNAMVAAGIKCELKAIGTNGAHLIDNSLSAEAHGGRRSWIGRPTGEYKVCVGETYRDMPVARYPQRKDGTFNYAKICSTVQERLDINKAVANRERKELDDEQAAKALVKELADEFGLKADGHGSVSGSTMQAVRWYQSGNSGPSTKYVAPRGRVYYEGRAMTPAQVRIMFKALQEINAIEQQIAASAKPGNRY